MMRRKAGSLLQRPELLKRRGAIDARRLYGSDQNILRRVFSRDEFDQLYLVAGSLEKQRTRRIGHEIGLTLLQKRIFDQAL